MKIYLILLSTCLLSLPAFAEDMYGVFLIVKPEVKIKRGNEVLIPKNGDRILPGDTVATTGAGGRAKIKMKDGNIISVSPNTTFTMSAYSNDGDQKNVEIKLKGGKIRSEVNVKYDGKKSRFLIKTPTAVAGVRGTDFITSFNRSTRVTQVVTIHGTVALTSLRGGGAPALVTMGQMASVASAEQPPAPPVIAPPEQMSEIKQEFETAPPAAATPSAPAGGGSGASESNGDSGAGNSSPDGNRQPASDSGKKKGGALRIGDDVDQSDSTFNQNVDTGKKTGTPAALLPNRPPVPAGSNPVRDASQGAQLQKKSKVTVIPELRP